MVIRPNKVKTILVTGGAGFIGSHLVKALLDLDYHVIVPYIEIKKKSIFYVNKLFKKCTLVYLDVTNKRKVDQLFKSHKIDFIFHLAADTIVEECFKNPLKTFSTNIIGTVHLLEAARCSRRVRGIIVASSDKAYGKTTRKYTEDSPLKGDHPYDVSKSCVDLISQTYFKSYNTPVAITRFGNVYGEGDLHFDRIIPGICSAIIRKKTLDIRSDGSYIRDYIYIKDVVDGYLFLFKYMTNIYGNAYNFSSLDTLSVLQIIKKAEAILKVKIPYRIVNSSKNEIPYQHLDIRKIKKLGWRPSHNFENVLPNVFHWYKKNL